MNGGVKRFNGRFPQIYLKYIYKKYPNCHYSGIGYRLIKNWQHNGVYTLPRDWMGDFKLNKQKLMTYIGSFKHKYQFFTKTKEGIIHLVHTGLIQYEDSDVLIIEANVKGIDLSKLPLKNKSAIAFINKEQEVIGTFDNFKILGYLSRDKDVLIEPINYI